MSTLYELVIQEGMIVNHFGKFKTDIAINNGKISAIGNIHKSQARQALNAKGLHVLPGVIDTQVHFREPGLEWKEDLETGSRAAVMGGVCTVFEMPNTNPSTINEVNLKDKLERAKGRMHCDHAFYIGATKENINELKELETLEGCCGIKVFMGASTGSLLVSDDLSIFQILNKINKRAAFHSEDEYRLEERRSLAIKGDYQSHLIVRDAKAAIQSTKRLVELARKANKRIHVLHVSTQEEIKYLKAYKDIASVEVTPQHLTLFAPECYEKLGSYAQMNPPIRDKQHQEGLWYGIHQGIVDVIGSDHAPHSLEEKSRLYPETPSGMPGVQTLVPVMLNHVNQGKLSIEHFVDLTSYGATRLFPMKCKGRLAVGYDADLTLVDLDKTRRVEQDWLVSKCGWSPFQDCSLKGWPKSTIIRGNIIMFEDELLKTGYGKPVRFF